MEIIHIANYKGDSKNGIDIVLNNLVSRSRFNSFIYPLQDIDDSNKSNSFLVLSLFFLIKKMMSGKPQFVVFHSIYNYRIIILYILVRIFKLNYCVFPHSSLTIESQKKSKIRKIIFRFVFLNRLISNSSYINFLNDEEVCRSYVKDCEYKVVGNGVDLGIKTEKENYISFLGRYDINHKGIDILLEALLIASPILRVKGFQVIFHGVCEKKADLDRIFSYVVENKIDDIVNIGGPIVDPLEKNLFLSKSKYYILTSRYEGLPITVLEAFSNGTPVIVTPGTNTVNMVLDNGLGYSSCLDSNSIADTIISALSIQDEDYFSMSERCYNYARDNLCWDYIVSKHDGNYEQYYK